MPTSCCALNCTNRKDKGSRKKFFRIPAEPGRRAAWLRALKRSDFEQGKKNPTAAWTPRGHERVCSDHFISGNPSKDPADPDYVPSLFNLPTSASCNRSRNPVAKKDRYMRAAKRLRVSSENEAPPTSLNDEEMIADPPPESVETLRDPLPESVETLREQLTKVQEEKCSSRAMCKPFLVDGQQVGWVWPGVEKHIQRFPDVFMVEEKQVSLCPSLQTYEERTERVQEVMLRLREEGDFIALKGWRDEMYEVFHQRSSPPVFRMERTATALLGVKQYGVHVNGYVEHPQKGPLMWIGRRAKNKSTYPNKLDQVTAGGFTAGLTAQEVLVKECAEEANIPQDIALTAQPAGAISYFYEDERGLFPEIQFVFDLKLPLDFQPVNTDGEVSEFYLWDMDKVKEQIAQPDFKPNCAMVVLDFLIRHGHIHPDQDRPSCHWLLPDEPDPNPAA